MRNITILRDANHNPIFNFDSCQSLDLWMPGLPKPHWSSTSEIWNPSQ